MQATTRPPDTFTEKWVPALQRRLFRLGLSASFGLDEKGVAAALERGLNYVFWSPTMGRMTRALRPALQRDRGRYVVSAGPTFGYFPWMVRRGCERALKVLGTDYLDVFQLYWAGVMSAVDERTLAELQKLKDEGKVRAIGLSIHDRPRAGRLAEDSALDLFMIRYNAAHPGAERDIFPKLAKRRPAVVAYTATRWRKLLKPHKGWDGPPMTAGDCYRFCLSNPHVDVTLCGPRNEQQLDEDLVALQRGPLSGEELARALAFGRVVHG